MMVAPRIGTPDDAKPAPTVSRANPDVTKREYAQKWRVFNACGAELQAVMFGYGVDIGTSAQVWQHFQA
jgi:hypothetical protein